MNTTPPKFTPGPWSRIMDDSGPDLIMSQSGNVARLNYPNGLPYRPLDEQMTNADLIAAAPDMLEALQAILPHLEANGLPSNGPRMIVERVIAMALGVQQQEVAS